MQGTCKNCNFDGSILKHIARNELCYKKYSKKELDELNRKRDKIRLYKQRQSYDPQKRRRTYLMKINRDKKETDYNSNNSFPKSNVHNTNIDKIHGIESSKDGDGLGTYGKVENMKRGEKHLLPEQNISN